MKIYAIIVGSLATILIFIFLGMITVLIPNNFFTRMSPVHVYDYVFLVLTSLLIGIYFGLWYYKKKTRTQCEYAAVGGLLSGVFSFGCAICNQLLVFLLGVTGVVTYFMPFQPFLGMMSVGMLSYGIYKQVRL